jgi:hypothetical protein
VIETLGSGDPQYALVDSCIDASLGKRIPPAYEYLRAQGVKKLNAVVVTHLHRDHYVGIEMFLHHFRIERLFVPPFLSRNDKIHDAQINKTKDRLRKAVAATNDEMVVRPAMSLAHLLNFITNNVELVEEATGRSNQISICGIPATIYLPLPGIKGALQHKISSAEASLEAFSEMNDASIAVCLDYGGHRILLTGDSTLDQWTEHKRQLSREKIVGLSVTELKVPHHGSRHNNTPEIYKYFLEPRPFGTGARSSGEGAVSIVSANGRTHPHNEYFSLVQQYDLQPYCTNLAEQCRPPNVKRLTALSNLPVQARPFVDNYEVEGPSVACQGDIVLEVSSTGQRQVRASTGLPCIYRGLTKPGPPSRQSP